jgi:hypothetical protein
MGCTVTPGRLQLVADLSIVGHRQAFCGDRRPWCGPESAYRFNLTMLNASTLCLAWNSTEKLSTHSILREELARQGIEHRQFLSLPSPFNTILWRFVALTP